MYHRFVTEDEYRNLTGSERIYSIPINRFRDQLKFLNDQGYRSVSMDDAVAFLENARIQNGPAVLITIDDGCRSVLTRALPLLAEFRHRATLFVTTDPSAYVFASDNPEQRRLTDDELRQIDPDVIEIGAHGHTHRPLTSLSDMELLNELTQSREILEQILGRPITALAVPGGWYDDNTVLAARHAGYTTMCVSDLGAIRPGHDRMRLRRLNVAGYLSIDAFRDNLEPSSIARRRIMKAVRQLPQRVVGPRAWEQIGPTIRRLFPPDATFLSILIRVFVLLAIVSIVIASILLVQRPKQAP